MATIDDDSRPLRRMQSIRDVLNEIEAELYPPARPDKYEIPCRKCWGTNTELIRNEETKTTTARPCSH